MPLSCVPVLQQKAGLADDADSERVLDSMQYRANTLLGTCTDLHPQIMKPQRFHCALAGWLSQLLPAKQQVLHGLRPASTAVRADRRRPIAP